MGTSRINKKKSASDTSGRLVTVLLTVAICHLLLLLLASCGRKGPPVLRSVEKPDHPTRLKAIKKEDKIILSWDFPEHKEVSISGFIIYKSSRSSFRKIAHVDKRGRSYIDAESGDGIEYSFKISSQGLEGVLSSDSNLISVLPSRRHSPREDLP
jgi:predicted small lipoprotein YifL